METAVIIVFVLGYLAITLEHTLKIDKLIPAIAMMAIAWTLVSVSGLDVYEIVSGEGLKLVSEKHGESPVIQVLLHHLGKTAEILIFLIGAMTIVEIIDQFKGFSSIKRFIKTHSKVKMLWILGFLAFILSAIIDNLTATIVLITILRKIIPQAKQRMWFAGLIIIAANAGGAWSPIGDVTTTMLWIAHKVEVINLIKYLLLPSLVCMVIPFAIASKLPAFKGKIKEDENAEEEQENEYGLLMLILGLSMIVFVPIFKTITHLPPYIGMMLSLAVVAAAAEYLSSRAFDLSHLGEDHNYNAVHMSLSKIEMPSILFFLGILMAVAALESLGTLFNFAQFINDSMPEDLMVMLLGLGSAVIDNVPLVAASIGMFTAESNSPFWHFIAYSAGTGGSILIIGSAAGVVAMGMEKINFFWYLKNISWLAFIGYAAGIVVFLFMREYIY